MAVQSWMERSQARPGADSRDIVAVLACLDGDRLTTRARDVADSAAGQLLCWIWADQICTATGRRAAVAAQLGYAWDTDDGYPSTPYTRSWL